MKKIKNKNLKNKKFQKKILSNGMTLIFEKRDLPVVSVGIGVRAGGVHEKNSEKGISHFIEHLLYKGTQTKSNKEIVESIEKNGGELNGFTSEEITAYWCKMPSKHLNVALEVLSDLVKNPLFDEKEIEKERQVIFEEIKMRKDNPQIFIFDEIQNCLYGGSLALPVPGTFESLKSIGRKKILDFFKKIYCAENFVVSVVGNADFKNLVSFFEKNFESYKGKISEPGISLKNCEKVLRRKGIDQANLIFAYHTPLSGNKKSYAARVLSVMMAEGMSSRLFQEIREKRNLAYGVKGFSEINNLFSYNGIYVGTTAENVSEVKNLILKEFEKIAGGLEEAELAEVKEQIIGNYFISQEDSQGQMVNLLMNEIDEDVKNFYEFEKNIKAVKLQDVKEIAKSALKKFSFLALVPE